MTNPLRSLWLALLLLALVACDQAPVPSLAPNQPPDTDTWADAPVDRGDRVLVTVGWTGTDPDGEVVHFQWRVLDESVADHDPEWESTEDTERTFTFLAGEVAGKTIDELMRRVQVRAVDDLGAVDTTPAEARFSPVTLPPTVNIVLPQPIRTLTCRQVSTNMVFQWVAQDPDRKGKEPEATRYLLLPVQQCLTQSQFEQQNPFRSIPSDDPRWSDWIPYERGDELLTGNQYVELPATAPGTNYLFAAQARDIHGAVSKRFAWGFDVLAVRTSSNTFPALQVHEPLLGEVDAVREREVLREVIGGQEIRFQLAASAIEYGGSIDAYRYGWDLVDPDDPDDPGWSIPWTKDPDDPVARSFQEGSHNFVVQVRDHGGNSTRLIYRLEVRQLVAPSERRPVLLVDDWPSSPGPSGLAQEVQDDDDWAGLLGAVVADFRPTDVVDAQLAAADLTLAKLLEYRAVIWFVSASQATFLHTRFDPQAGGHNWLEAYQAYGGNLLITGAGPMQALLESKSWVYPLPLDRPSHPPLGLGITQLLDGEIANRGTLRQPYRGFCLETIDRARPGVGFVFGEHDTPGTLQRRMGCCGLGKALVSDDLLDAYPSASGLPALRPTQDRLELAPIRQFTAEEFYDTNVTSRPIDPQSRDCLIPMFRWSSRADEGVEVCGPGDSPISGAPVAFLSTAYASTKPTPGPDAVWGFHPLAFEPEDVGAALAWILGDLWGIPTLD